MVRKYLTGILAAGALLIAYAVGSLAVTGLVMTVGSNSAQAARGEGGRGGRGGRGVGRGGFVRGGRGRGGRGRGRGIWRGGVWLPWIAPGLCHEVPTSRRVYCDL